jgi:hypothetical protein
VFENRMLIKKVGPKSKEVIADWKKCIVRSFMIPNPHRI